MKTRLLLSALVIALTSTLAHAQITLYAAWDLNEGTGTATTQAQRSGNAEFTAVTNPLVDLDPTVSAAFNGSATWGGASTAPWSTASLVFNGDGGKNHLNTNVSGAGLAGTGAKTFVAWINPTGLDGSGGGIVSYSPQGGQSNGADLRFLLDGNGDLRAEVSGGFFLHDGASLVNQGWNMVAVVFDTDTENSWFYVGGVGRLDPTSFGARAIDTSGTEGAGDSELNIVIGGAQVTNRSFVGAMDMIAIYNGAATIAELDEIFLAGVIPEPSTYAMLIAGLVALMVIARRRKL